MLPYAKGLLELAVVFNGHLDDGGEFRVLLFARRNIGCHWLEMMAKPNLNCEKKDNRNRMI